ncbi:hypothetical protein CDL15_Pgr005915 [Punica granatum]|uniref:Uncharacterized protein n=1 Tax=Punica granatum TaxID=22663 RepID=A0A218WFW4_PUNGR|nr:hypothetical protein CDL15_Pgr005915 [Punica granatum]
MDLVPLLMLRSQKPEARSQCSLTMIRNNGGKWSSKPVRGKKRLLPPSPDKKLEEKSSTARGEGGEDNASLDRLLLVQSVLTNLTRQIDGIGVQAFHLKEIGKQGTEEIESFGKGERETEKKEM